jgi:transposase
VSENTPPANPRFEEIRRDQTVLEPVDIESLIPAGHRARTLWDFLGELDLTAFAAGVKAVQNRAGRDPWPPRLLIAMWLYGYSRGLSSAREMERQCAYEPGFRWLTGLRVVNYHTLSDFRVQHGEALQQLFVQVLGVLTLKKLIALERVTIDGTKIRAHANKKSFSREGKIREHLATARQHLEDLQKEEEQQEKRGRQAAAQKRAAQERVARLESAVTEIQRLQADKKQDKQKPCQASTTDADAQFMRTGDQGLAPCYNVQLATDSTNKLFVGVSVSKQPSDAANLVPAVEAVKKQLGRYPEQVLADGDYTTRAAVMGMADRDIDFYGSWNSPDNPAAYGIQPEYEAGAFRYVSRRNEMICPEGKRLAYHATRELEGEAAFYIFAADQQDCQQCPKRMQCTPQNSMSKHGRTISVLVEDPRVEQFHAKMENESGKAIYKTRAPIAEFPHAWLKAKFNWVRFRCQGLAKVTAEALWACLAYNLQNYFRLVKAA